MVKHIKHISVRYAPSTKFAGVWDSEKYKFTFNSYAHATPEHAEQIVYHELIGHAFYQWAEKWRHSEWEAFNKLANELPPVNDYVVRYLKYKVDGRTDTIYENEQHSAIAELVMHGKSYFGRTKTDITEEQVAQLTKLWEELHY